MNKNVKNGNFGMIVCSTLLLVTALLISGCDEASVNYKKNSPSISLKINTTISNYSVAGELLQFSYLVTNNGNISLDGPVVTSSSLISVDCPGLVEIGNNDALMQPGESVVCSSLYVTTPTDLTVKSIVNTAKANVGGITSNLDSLTVINITESFFIFPFDTADPSVIFRSSLTSPDAIFQNGGTEGSGSLNTYDSLLGMKPGAVINGSPGCSFTSSSIRELTSLPSGQLSLEVEREWLAITDANIGSIGYNRNSIEYLLSHGASDVSDMGRVMMQSVGALLFQFSPLDVTRSARYVNTNQSDRFARVTISWTPGETTLYLDGLPLARVNRADENSDRFSNIFLGSLGGGSENSMQSNYYVRNLIVSSQPVITSSKPLLGYVMHIGDSFAAGQPLVNAAPKYDGTIVNTVIRELLTSGFAYEKYTVYSNGGGKIQDFSNDPLELDVTNGGGKTRAEALSEDPSLIVFITGGNDLGIFQPDLFSTDLHDHIEAFLGVNGHPPTNVQHVIITTTTSSSLAASDNLLAMREIMLELPNWWDAVYTNMQGKVHVVDTWQLFGGANVDQSLFNLKDHVHPSSAGDIVYGKAIAEKIMQLTH